MVMRLALLLVALGSCRGEVPPDPTPVQQAELVRSYPHDPRAFTQGLIFRDGTLYESTGQKGHSTVRRVRLDDGQVLTRASLPAQQFGEGLAAWGNELISLTWKDGTGYRWDAATLTPRGRFRYRGQGWGLTANDDALILSDGTAELRFLDPVTFVERRRLRVTAGGRAVTGLNELEWVDGEILANVWRSDRIARIDPATGVVRAWVDLRALAAEGGGEGREEVLNGIAWDAQGKRLFVTGKRWNKLFEIRLAP